MIALKIQVTSAGLVVNTKKQLRATMRKAGAEVLQAARGKMAKAGAGRVYYGSGGSKFRSYQAGRHQASSPGEPPTVNTGMLRRSGKVKPFKSGEGVVIRFRAYYALFLEAGARGGVNHGGHFLFDKRYKGARANTKLRRSASGVYKSRVMAARPFLSTALSACEASLSRRISAAVNDDIAFVPQKWTVVRGKNYRLIGKQVAG